VTHDVANRLMQQSVRNMRGLLADEVVLDPTDGSNATASGAAGAPPALPFC